MRRLIRNVAKALGVSTDYHVAGTWSGGTIDMTVTIKPWLHADNFKELRDFVADELKHQALGVKPNIVNITRLGP